MADAPTLSPELSRSVSALARTLVAAARSWALYPPEHPAVRGSLDRLRVAIGETTDGQVFAFGVTPDTLLVAGIAVGGARRRGDRRSRALAARPRHPPAHLRRRGHRRRRCSGCSAMLSEDSRIIRQRGGPAKVWTEEGDAAIAVEQIDFSQVLEDREVTNPVRRKDDIWRSIVRGILDRKKPTDEAAQARLLEISGDVDGDRRAGQRRHRAAPHDGRLADADLAGGRGGRRLPSPRRHRRRPVARAQAGGHAEPRDGHRQPQPARRHADARRRRDGRRGRGPAKRAPAPSSPGSSTRWTTTASRSCWRPRWRSKDRRRSGWRRCSTPSRPTTSARRAS